MVATFNDLRKYIETDATDVELDLLIDSVKFRRDQLAAQKRRDLTPGTKVRFISKARKFAGQEGVVKRRLAKNVEVEIAADHTPDCGGDTAICWQHRDILVRSHPTLLEAI